MHLHTNTYTDTHKVIYTGTRALPGQDASPRVCQDVFFALDHSMAETHDVAPAGHLRQIVEIGVRFLVFVLKRIGRIYAKH